MEPLSLDAYIKKKKMQDQFCLLNHRKREKDISAEVLNHDLDAYIRGSRINKTPTAQTSTAQSSGSSKFDRKSIRGEDSSDEEESGATPVKIVMDEDVDMEENHKTLDTIGEEEENSLEGLFKFSTVESRQGIRVPSQQWRMLPENLLDRPAGVKRLEFLPLNDQQRYKRIRYGKVRKNRHRTSSISSCSSDATMGSFVEKGKFTYKFGDRNRDGRSEGIIGIERAKHFDAPDPPVIVPNVVTAAAAPSININMNWDGFFTGFNQAVTNTQKLLPAPPATEPASSELAAATKKLLALLQGQRDETYNIKKEILENDVMSSSGSGFVDCEYRPQSSGFTANGPPNFIRFD